MAQKKSGPSKTARKPAKAAPRRSKKAANAGDANEGGILIPVEFVESKLGLVVRPGKPLLIKKETLKDLTRRNGNAERCCTFTACTCGTNTMTDVGTC